MLVITVISGYSSTFLLIGSKREQRGLNEPAVRPIQPAQEVVVPRYAVIWRMNRLRDQCEILTLDGNRFKQHAHSIQHHASQSHTALIFS